MQPPSNRALVLMVGVIVAAGMAWVGSVILALPDPSQAPDVSGIRAARASGSSDPTSGIMSLPTWSARLKKLEEVKAQVEPARYERLHKFFAVRAAKEKKENQ